MMDTGFWAWPTLVALGAFHGLNPGMGWLFAVALGLQEGSRRAVWRALLPLAAGHALAIGLALAAAMALGVVVPLGALKWLVAGTLLGYGVYRTVRQRHPRWGGMRVGFRDLVIWSLLMASAHGAGVMVLPAVLPDEAAGPARVVAEDHAAHMRMGPAPLGIDPGPAAAAARPPAEWNAIMATVLHSIGYLVVTAMIAVLVYEKLGLRFLRTMWFNLDYVWAGALVVTAVVVVW